MKVRISQAEAYKHFGTSTHVPIDGIELEAESYSTFEQKVLDELTSSGTSYTSIKAELINSNNLLQQIVTLLGREHTCARCGKIMQIQK